MSRLAKYLKADQEIDGNTELEAFKMEVALFVSVQIKFAGSGTGKFKLQVSHDTVHNKDEIETWVDVAGSETRTLTFPGACVINMQNIQAVWVRPVFTGPSGDGFATVIALLKGGQ